jgi:hypothetical protein
MDEVAKGSLYGDMKMGMTFDVCLERFIISGLGLLSVVSISVTNLF